MKNLFSNIFRKPKNVSVKEPESADSSTSFEIPAEEAEPSAKSDTVKPSPLALIGQMQTKMTAICYNLHYDRPVSEQDLTYMREGIERLNNELKYIENKYTNVQDSQERTHNESRELSNTFFNEIYISRTPKIILRHLTPTEPVKVNSVMDAMKKILNSLNSCIDEIDDYQKTGQDIHDMPKQDIYRAGRALFETVNGPTIKDLPSDKIAYCKESFQPGKDEYGPRQGTAYISDKGIVILPKPDSLEVLTAAQILTDAGYKQVPDVEEALRENEKRTVTEQVTVKDDTPLTDETIVRWKETYLVEVTCVPAAIDRRKEDREMQGTYKQYKHDQLHHPKTVKDIMPNGHVRGGTETYLSSNSMERMDVTKKVQMLRPLPVEDLERTGLIDEPPRHIIQKVAKLTDTSLDAYQQLLDVRKFPYELDTLRETLNFTKEEIQNALDTFEKDEEETFRNLGISNPGISFKALIDDTVQYLKDNRYIEGDVQTAKDTIGEMDNEKDREAIGNKSFDELIGTAKDELNKKPQRKTEPAIKKESNDRTL